MTGTSQGNAHPEPASTLPHNTILNGTPSTRHARVSDDEWAHAAQQATQNVTRIETLNRTSNQRGNSWSLPIPDGTYSRTPTWTSRTHWQQQVRTLLNSPTGTTLCTTHTISIEAVFAVAVTHASLAESATGRSVTASRETIARRAGVSTSTVKRARRVLTALGVAVELVRGRYLSRLEAMAAESHHGYRQFRAASAWALTTPRPVATTVTPPFTKPGKPSRATPRTAAYRSRTTTRNHPQSGTRDPLSPSGGFALKALAFKISPTRTQAHAGKTTHQPTTTPRPLHLQRAAAELIAHAPALKPAGHIGTICDTLQQSGIDTTRWTGRDIAHQLTADTQRRGWIWPSDIARPAAFLRWRLAQISWAAATPTEKASQHDHFRLAEQAARRAEIHARDKHAATRATRARILQTLSMRTHLLPAPRQQNHSPRFQVRPAG
ncbi:hypothetical protein [Rhodococcus qingshengii]|uniref:hypothetical protein n=1 Tax=Rhodococcus qingshengii TaxID=334542 RepID=UPI00237D1568|nr:hypothetical protein [Rhodococcus qingshengii]WCT05965.1 hypothetical protein PI247_29540 [Rhodococcus qingshengii]